MPVTKTEKLLNAATATSAAPTDEALSLTGKPKPQGVDQAEILLYSTAGSGTMEVTVRLWGYVTQGINKWFPLSTGSGAGATGNTSGWLNGGKKIEEIAADRLAHYEKVLALSRFERIYAQVVAIAGTATAVSLDIVWHKAEYV